MSQDLLTIKEIARRLSQPESNIRYYRDRFDKFLPSVGEGRKKRFTPEALEVFRAIVEELGRNMSSQEIEQELARRFSQNPSQITSREMNAGRVACREEQDGGFFLQQTLLIQSRALDRLSMAIHKERGILDDMNRLHTRQDKLKKAVCLLWKGYRKNLSRQAADTESQEMTDLRHELDSLKSRQGELEKKVMGEMEAIRQELRKCQFWTKRLLMAASREKTDSGLDTDAKEDG